MMTVEETAKLAHVHPRTVRRAIQRGELAAMRLSTGKRSVLALEYYNVKRWIARRHKANYAPRCYLIAVDGAFKVGLEPSCELVWQWAERYHATVVWRDLSQCSVLSISPNTGDLNVSRPDNWYECTINLPSDRAFEEAMLICAVMLARDAETIYVAGETFLRQRGYSL